ncbi:unnamed protein product [Allacma fusca]|uniref:Uncharacterized protein n=1 Tax=Allacma fusca TaxID=39272 RepID=A0A8J2LMC2_9HEXA|nr:unnamed protein product [Allacma fusca]
MVYFYLRKLIPNQWFLLLLLTFEVHSQLPENGLSESNNPMFPRLREDIPLEPSTDYLSEWDSSSPKNNYTSHGRAAAPKPKKGDDYEDPLMDLPKYTDLTDIEDEVVLKIQDIWKAVNDLTPAQRLDRDHIDDKLWPQILLKLRESHFRIREMDTQIFFKRKPSALMDALFRIESLKDLQNIISKRGKSNVEMLTVQYFELSSAASQMHRFYAKRIRDILRDEPRIGMVALSILTYKGYTWSSTTNYSESAFTLSEYLQTAGITRDRMIWERNNTTNGASTRNLTDIWVGIRELLQSQPDVAMKAQYDGKICQANDTLFSMEPAGLDGPYYVLFYICLTDIKFYVLYNFALIYKQIYQGIVPDEKTLASLRSNMRSTIQMKIDMFDEAFNIFMSSTGPSYQSYPGVSTCDPDNWEYGDSYEQLTNFVKVFVFVAKEQALHKAGNCKQTCDLLDATYRPCHSNESDCLVDEEMECLTKKKQCDQYEPPCPPRAYQCQTASAIVTTCPSARKDRLYEFIQGEDYRYGSKDHVCQNETTTLKGKWNMEPDTLVDTPHYCDICACYCFEPLKPLLGAFSVRYFSVAGSPSLIKFNYIIVGVKFERVDDQITIRIAQAVALPNYKVNTSTIEWIPVKKEKEAVRLDRDLRSVNLDDVVTQERNRVVTGVKFVSATYRGHVQYNYLGLQIRTHEITPAGKIVNLVGKLAKNANSTANRVLYKYPDDPDGPDDPILAVGKALPDTTSNQYIVFLGSSLHKDAAQQTIPFFDTQKLIRKEPKWLKGVGIYHKSRPGFGGFLAFKLIEHHDS